MSQLKFVSLSLSCLDHWMSLPSTSDRIPPTYASFINWVLNTHNSPNTPSVVTHFLAHVMSTEQPSLYTAEQIRKKLKACNSFARNFRVVSALVRRPDERANETRVRDMFESILAQNMPFSFSGLFCTFFSDTGSTRTKCRSSSSFRTVLSTRFEQTLFLSAIVQLCNVVRFWRKRKREDGSSSVASDRIIGLNGVGGAASQRTGFTVQVIVRGWDTFAVFLGFKNLETMIKPYLLLRGPLAKFEIIKDRSVGFVPDKPNANIDMTLEPTPDVTKTFPFVRHYEECVDAAIRLLAKTFLEDIYDATASSSLHSLEVHERWEYLERFKSAHSTLPDRFIGLHSEDCQLIRRAMQASMASRTVPHVDEDTVSSEDTVNPQESVTAGEREATTVCRREESLSQDEAISIVKQEMQSWVFVHNCSFRDFMDIHEANEHAFGLEEKVQLALLDPPYNIRRNRGRGNADYDVLEIPDMSDIVTLLNTLLRPGGHAIIFCTAQQYAMWARLFERWNEGREDEKETYMVDSSPLFVVYHPSCRKSFPGRKSCSLSNKAEMCIHVKKNGLPFAEEEKMVNYRNFNHVLCTYPAYTNVINNVMDLLPGEKLMARQADSKSMRALRPEQKSLALLMELISRFSNPGDIVIDLFGGTFSCANACMSLKQPRRFAGCEKDSECFRIAQDNVLRYFAQGAVENKSAFNMETKGVLAAKEFCQGIKTALTEKDPKWSAPKRFPPYQVLPLHIIQALSTLWEDSSFHTIAIGTPPNEWPEKYHGLLQQVDISTLRTVDACCQGLIVAPSTIKHPNAGLGVFAAKSFQKGQTVSKYFGTIVYHDLSRRKETKKIYGSGVLGIDVDRFNKYAVQIKGKEGVFDEVRGLLDGKKTVFVVPAPFCAGALVNDNKYDDEDEEYMAYMRGEILSPRKVNVEITQTEVRSIHQIYSPLLVTLRATRLINLGDELFTDFSKEDFAGRNERASDRA